MNDIAEQLAKWDLQHGELVREVDGHLVWAADYDALAAKLAKAVEKFAALEKTASDVARRGAETGPQWTKLTIALLAARAALAELKGENDD